MWTLSWDGDCIEWGILEVYDVTRRTSRFFGSGVTLNQMPGLLLDKGASDNDSLRVPGNGNDFLRSPTWPKDEVPRGSILGAVLMAFGVHSAFG